MLVVILVSLASCSRSMNYVIDNEPHFAGIVEEVIDDYVVVKVNKNESIFKDYPTVYASLDVELADSYLDFEVGDEIVIYYDGNISNGTPAKAEKVYAITIITPQNRGDE